MSAIPKKGLSDAVAIVLLVLVSVAGIAVMGGYFYKSVSQGGSQAQSAVNKYTAAANDAFNPPQTPLENIEEDSLQSPETKTKRVSLTSIDVTPPLRVQLSTAITRQNAYTDENGQVQYNEQVLIPAGTNGTVVAGPTYIGAPNYQRAWAVQLDNEEYLDRVDSCYNCMGVGDFYLGYDPVNDIDIRGVILGESYLSTTVIVPIRIIKMGIIEDFITTTDDEDLTTAENLLNEKQPDVLLFHEDFLEGFTSRDYYYLTLNKTGNRYIIENATTADLLRKVNLLVNLSRDHTSNIIFVAGVLFENQGYPATMAIALNTSGDIIDVYPKGAPFHLVNFTTRDNTQFNALTMICSYLEIYKSLTLENTNVDIFFNPGWGNWQTLGLAVTEYQHTGDVSQETFDFLNGTRPHDILIRTYAIDSREDLLNSIRLNLFPFERFNEFRTINSQKHSLHSEGYIISADQIQSNAIIKMDGQKLRKLEHGVNYSYLYGEIELP